VVPSDGTTSFSLWDVADPETLLQWLGDNLGGDCITQLHEVQEDFTWGLSLELARMRAAERVSWLACGIWRLLCSTMPLASAARGDLHASLTWPARPAAPVLLCRSWTAACQPSACLVRPRARRLVCWRQA
jgi:hypothetical protein